MEDHVAYIRAKNLRRNINDYTGYFDDNITTGVQRLLNDSGSEKCLVLEPEHFNDEEVITASEGYETYKQIEYLESTGNKEYINTNFIPNVQTDTFKIKFKITDTASTTDTWPGVIGAQSRVNGSGSNFGAWYTPWNKLIFGTVYTNKIFEITCSPFFDQTVLTDIDNYIAGNVKLNHAIMENSTVPLTLYYRNYPEFIVGPGKGTQYGKCRIYYLQIFRNDVLIKNYIPKHKGYAFNDGSFYKTAVGMHEVIDDVLYLNTGTGSFIEGPYI